MSIKAEVSFSLKDHLFNKESVKELAEAISKNCKEFNSIQFQQKARKAFPQLELKDRMIYLADLLHDMIPGSYRKQLKVISKSLPPELDSSKTDDDFGRFIWGVPGTFVARNGCKKEYLDSSLQALEEMTKRFSSEFPLRFFLNNFEKETMEYVHRWSQDKNYHVRRLASEGIRPSLPWAQKVSIDAREIIAVLDNLYSDSTRYVTRSVANNMNDISKIDPDLVIKTLDRWKESDKQESDEMNFIIKHSLRTLLKQGNPAAMRMLGFDPHILVQCKDLVVPKKVRIGDSFEISFIVISEKNVEAMINYELGYRNARGGFSPKIHKVATTFLQSGKEKQFSKKHRIRPMTTRTLYPGKHTVTIIVNGKRLAVTDFILTK